MIIRYSLKNLLRSRGKSALFLLLIFVLTLLIGLDTAVLSAVGSYLDVCDSAYTTVALLEYMGADYPDETIRDAAMDGLLAEDCFAQMAQDGRVLCWDACTRALGYVEGFTRRDTGVYNTELAVLVLSGAQLQSNGLYWCSVAEELYAYRNCRNKILYFDAMGVCELQPDHYYVVAGTFYASTSSNLYFRVASFRNATAAESGEELEIGHMIADVTTPDGAYQIAQDSVFRAIAQTERVVNSALDVYATDRLEAQLPFQQSKLYLVAGRGFTEEEYASGAKVCVVSERLCKELGVGLGDTIPLCLASSATAPVYESYWAGSGFAEQAEYTIVGMTNALTELNHYCYIPKAATGLAVNQVGYTIATLLLENQGAAEFYETWQPQLPERVLLTIYDQGYGAAAEPFREIQRIALLITAVCVLVCLCVLALYGYLFVYRQRDVAQIMLRLGAGRRRIRLHFLFGAGLLAFCAAALGAVAGWLLSGRVNDFVARFAEDYALQDGRFSNGNLSVTREMIFSPQTGAAPFVLVALAVFLLASASCLGFLRSALRRPRSRVRRSRRQPRSVRSSTLRPGAAKDALLSIRRGGARTIIAPLTALLAAVFLCQLAAAAANYDSQLTRIYSDTELSGALTDINGRQTGRLVLGGNDLNTLASSGYLDRLSVSKSYRMLYEGVSEHAGEAAELEPPQIPTNPYALETFMNQISNGPRLVFTNDLAAAPEFYYATTVETSFLEGWDAGCLASGGEVRPGVWPCLLSTDFMARNGIALGDTIRLLWFTDEWFADEGEIELQLYVVGTYVRQGSKDNVYCALGCYFDPELFTIDRENPWYPVLYRFKFDSASFTLADAGALEQFKRFLVDCGFSEATVLRRNRTFLVLEDKSFLSTVSTMQQQLRYVNVLYPCLYALSCLVGLVAAFLLTLSRKRELAIMRGLGATRGRAGRSFFWEQAVLCLAGAALGLALELALGSGGGLGAALTGCFVLSWCAGTLAALAKMTHARVLAILREEE